MQIVHRGPRAVEIELSEEGRAVLQDRAALQGWAGGEGGVGLRQHRHAGRNPAERDALVAGLDGKAAGLPPSMIGRIWLKFDLEPYVTDAFKIPEGLANGRPPLGQGRSWGRCLEEHRG